MQRKNCSVECDMPHASDLVSGDKGHESQIKGPCTLHSHETIKEQYLLVVYSTCSSQKLKYISTNSSGLPAILLFPCGVGDIFCNSLAPASRYVLHLQSLFLCKTSTFKVAGISRTMLVLVLDVNF